MRRPRLDPVSQIAFIIALVCAITALILAETPTGSVCGTLIAAESGGRLANISVNLWENQQERQYTTTTDSKGNFRIGHVAAGTYEVFAGTRAHQQPKGKITVREGQTWEGSLELAPVDPYLEVYADMRAFTTREEPRVRVEGFSPTTSIRADVYRLAPADAERAWNNSLEGFLLRRPDGSRMDISEAPGIQRVSVKSFEVVKRDTEGIFSAAPVFDRMNPGVYVVSFNAGPAKALAAFTITDLGIVVKASKDEAVVFAADLITNRPVSCPVVARGSRGDATEGTTGTDGICTLPLPPHGENTEIRFVARAGENLAVAGVTPWSEDDSGPLRVYTYTERPVYRPGQTVFYKSILRLRQGDTYSAPVGLPITARVTDRASNLIYAEQLSSNDFGSVNGSFALSASAIPGPYTLTIEAQGRTREITFAVAEYRKPEFEVTVKPDRERYAAGDTITATVQASYFFGGPVAGARTNYLISRAPWWAMPDDEIAEDEAPDVANAVSDSEGAEYVESGDIVTDSAGNAQITFRIPKDDSEDDLFGNEWRYYITAHATDSADRTESGTATAFVTQGAYAIQAHPDNWLSQPNKPVLIRIRTVDFDGKSVGGTSGDARLIRRVWNGNKERTEVVSRSTWKSDPQGAAVVQVIPNAEGDWAVALTSRDSEGRTIRGGTTLWVMARDGGAISYPYQDLTVRAGKRLYQPGETAEIVVNTAFAPCDALFTLESEGIIAKQLVRLQSKSTVLRVPLSSDMLPAVRANICFFRGKDFVNSGTVLNISRAPRSLKVQITTDAETYAPGDEAVYRVSTLDGAGNPVSAEVSLGVVDKSIYGVLPESTPDIRSFFYPRRIDSVQTAYSFPAIYLSGDDKGGADIKTRKYFPDTAFWEPSVVTNSQGLSEFRFKLPDNLTTWRATCRAATLDALVGQATQEIVVKKPFLVRLETPRFIVEGDEVRIVAVAHNMSPSAVSATIGVETRGLRIKDNDNRTVNIQPNREARIEWTGVAEPERTCKIRVWGRAGTLTDAVESTLPVLPKGRPRTTATNGVLTATTELPYQFRSDGAPGSQSLTLRLSPSIAGVMMSSLDYLANYPYGCTEQTLSAFLPDIALIRMIDRLGVANPGLRARLPDMVNTGLLRLSDSQRGDGGWGWWRYDEADPYMTAYAVYGLIQAQNAGFSVNREMRDRGVSALNQMVSATNKRMHNALAKGQPVNVDSHIYGAWVLALADKPKTAGDTARIYLTQPKKAERLSDWGRSVLALTLYELDERETARDQLEVVWQRFSAQAEPVRSATWRSRAESLGMLMQAALEVNPRDGRLPDLARRILDERRGIRWESTRDTATVLTAFARYLAETGELRPNLTATILVNGKQVASKRFGPEDVLKPDFRINLTAEQLGQNQGTVSVRLAGSGRLYYTVQTDEALTGELDQPVQSTDGLSIERSWRRVRTGPETTPPETEAPGRTQKRFETTDIVEVTLTIRTQKHFDYVMVEDALPAGCETRDRGRVEMWEWQNWWAEQLMRDRKACFAIRSLSPGVHRIRYRYVAQTPGSYTALPPVIYDMYNPQARAEGRAEIMEIKR